MEDLVKAETKKEETREEAPGHFPFLKGHEGGHNHSDPIPYFGGMTQDAIDLRTTGAKGLAGVDDELYAAVKSGNELRVRARMGGTDKIMSEGEAIILIRTRRHAEEIAYKKTLEQHLVTEEKDSKEEPFWGIFGHDAAKDAKQSPHLFGRDAYGGRYDSKKARYHDRFGGTYDAKGYQFADGSYKTAAGDYYNAAAHTVQLAIGGPAEMLPIELLGHGADVLRVAATIAALRAEKRRGALSELREVASITAGALASAKELQAAEAAAEKAVGSVTGAAPKAVPASATFTKAADDETAAYMAAAADREAEELAHFERMVAGEDFQRDAGGGPGEGLGHMSCNRFTRKDLRLAACVVGENIGCGRQPRQLNRFHYQTILSMVDDDEDGLADRLQLNLVVPTPLREEANGAFRRVAKTVAVASIKLKDLATAAFAKKSPADGAYEAIVEAMEQKPRLNFFRRMGAGLNIA